MLNIPTGGAELRRLSEDLIADALRDAGVDAISAEQLAAGICAIAESHDIPMLAVLWWIENECIAEACSARMYSLSEWRRWAAAYARSRARLERQPPPPEAA